MTGAMLMLNTDLHIAELSKHMSRADFVRNAMRAIQESAPNANGDSAPDLVRDDLGSVRLGSTSTISSTRNRPGQGTAPTSRSASAPVHSPQPLASRENERSVSVVAAGMDKSRASPSGSFMLTKAWETETENALKVGCLSRPC